MNFYESLKHNGVFHKWDGNSVNSANSGNLINHWSMDWGQFKYPASELCLVGVVLASWSLTETGGRFEPFWWQIILVTEFSKIFRKNSDKDLSCIVHWWTVLVTLIWYWNAVWIWTWMFVTRTCNTWQLRFAWKLRANRGQLIQKGASYMSWNIN